MDGKTMTMAGAYRRAQAWRARRTMIGAWRDAIVMRARVARVRDAAR